MRVPVAPQGRALRQAAGDGLLHGPASPRPTVRPAASRTVLPDPGPTCAALDRSGAVATGGPALGRRGVLRRRRRSTLGLGRRALP